MRRDPTRLRLLVALSGMLAAFCADDQATEPTMACTQEAIGGELTIDSRFPAVGTIAGCSATLVSDDAILFAAHCVSSFAQGCQSKSDAMATLRFTLAPSGCVSDVRAGSLECTGSAHVYALADLAVQPRSYDDGAPARCPPTSPENARCGPKLALATNLYPAFDLALARLRLRQRVAPATVAMPMRVVTSISDDAPSKLTVRRSVDTTRFREPLGCARPRAITVGWGLNDLRLDARVAGVMDFSAGETWDWTCQSVSACGSKPATPYCALKNASGAFPVQALLLHRGSTSPSAFDLGYVEAGDSGGPLVVQGGAGANALAELGDGDFVLGTLSLGGDATSVQRGRDVRAFYTATFEPSNARYLEETLERFAADALRDRDDDFVPVELDAGSADGAVAAAWR